MKTNPLKQYLSKFPRSSRGKIVSRIATKLRISKRYVYLMAKGERKIHIKFADQLEKVTDKEISSKQLIAIYMSNIKEILRQKYLRKE